MKVDYLIVGKGIAGTVLSFLLLKQKKSFLLVDNPSQSSASEASAGICNPVVFRKLTTGWRALQLLSEAGSFYESIGAHLGLDLVKDQKIFRVFNSPDERRMWENKINDPELIDLISVTDENPYPGIVNNPSGTGIVHKGMLVDIPSLLRHYHQYLRDKSLLEEEEFLYKDLQHYHDHISWKHVNASKIVFCEGYKVLQNPYFNWLPMNPVKGEALIIKASIPEKGYLINQKILLRPLGEDIYWAGATYNWDLLDETTTGEGRQELTALLDNLLEIPYEIIGHKAGVRPAVRDRRPLIGVHPVHKNMYVFNGLGTKGTMIAPHCGAKLIRLMEQGIEPDGEVNIDRFRKLFEEKANAEG